KKRTDITIFYSEHKINPLIHDRSPIEHVLLKQSLKLSDLLYQKYDMYLSKIQFNSEDNLYIPGSGIFRQPVVSVNRIFKSISTGGSTFLAFYLRSQYDSKTYVRTYKSV